MRSTLLTLVAQRDALFLQGASPSAVRDLNKLIKSMMKLLRARGELCACHADCLDESVTPLDDDSIGSETQASPTTRSSASMGPS